MCLKIGKHDCKLFDVEWSNQTDLYITVAF